MGRRKIAILAIGVAATSGVLVAAAQSTAIRGAPTALFSRPDSSNEELVAARNAADEMSRNMDGYVVAHSEIVGFEQDAMRRFLREALENPESFSEQFEFGVMSSLGSCAVQHVDELRKVEGLDEDVYRIHTSCSSAIGNVQIGIRYDSTKHQIATSMINSIIDLRIAPIQDMPFALAYEIVKGSYRENSLPAEF